MTVCIVYTFEEKKAFLQRKKYTCPRPAKKCKRCSCTKQIDKTYLIYFFVKYVQYKISVLNFLNTSEVL